MRPRILLAVLLIISLLAAPGCWNRRAPELLGLVLATAFDYDDARGLSPVIVQGANPIVMGGGQDANNGGGGGGGGPSFWTVSAFGQTPYEALQSLAMGTSREFFWAHNRVLLFSEKLARRGIGEILDLVARERQFRPVMTPAVVEGNLRRLMEAQFPLEESGARGLDRLIVTTQFDLAVFPLMLFYELYSTLGQPGVEMIIGKIEVLEEGAAGQGSGGAGGGSETGQAPPAQIGGAAVFRGDRMVGWADLNQVRGWHYATGRGIRFNFPVPCPDHEGGYFSIEIFSVKSSMRPAAGGQDLKVIIEVMADGRTEDVSCRHEHNLDVETELIKRIERACAQTIRDRIESMLSLSRELKSDFLGLGNLFYRKEPRLWREIEGRWEEILSGLVVEVRVKFNLTRPGVVISPGKTR